MNHVTVHRRRDGVLHRQPHWAFETHAICQIHCNKSIRAPSAHRKRLCLCSGRSWWAYPSVRANMQPMCVKETRKQSQSTSIIITTCNTIILCSIKQTNLHYPPLLLAHFESPIRSQFELANAMLFCSSKGDYGFMVHHVHNCIMLMYWPTKLQWPRLERAYALQRYSSH